MEGKKVLFLVNHDIVIYNFRKEIVEKLIEMGCEVIISSPKGKRIDALINMGCKYEELEINRHGKNPLEDFRLFKSYDALMKKYKPDVVLTFTIKPNIYGGLACRFNNIPYIVNITGLGTALEKPGLMQKLTTFMYKISMKKVETIFFQNQENLEFFKSKNIKPEKHFLLPGSGVNLNEFKLQKYPSDEWVNFVFISRIMREKGIEEYLQVAKYIKAKYPNTTFNICGFCEENYVEILHDYESKEIIKYHGMVDNINEFLKDMHCTIHPTYYPEGMSNVLLESAASGKPVITTNRSGARETVINGVSGFIVEPKNVEELKFAVENFLKLSHGKKREMGLKGREYVSRKFDRTIVVDEYVRRIRSILKKKGAR